MTGPSPRLSESSEFAPPPTDDEQIKIHYFKHHPLWEYKDFEDFHVDAYRHWLHGRLDYQMTETDPSKENPWQAGYLQWRIVILLTPLAVYHCCKNWQRKQMRRKNVPLNLFATTSQP